MNNWLGFETETQGFCREIKLVFYMTSNFQGSVKADWSNVPTVYLDVLLRWDVKII